MKNTISSKRVHAEFSPWFIQLLDVDMETGDSVFFFWITANGQHLPIPVLLSIEPEQPEDNLMPYSLGWEDDEDEFGYEDDFLEDEEDEDLFEEDDEEEEDLYYDELDEDFDEDEDYDDLGLDEDEDEF